MNKIRLIREAGQSIVLDNGIMVVQPPRLTITLAELFQDQVSLKITGAHELLSEINEPLDVIQTADDSFEADIFYGAKVRIPNSNALGSEIMFSPLYAVSHNSAAFRFYSVPGHITLHHE